MITTNAVQDQLLLGDPQLLYKAQPTLTAIEPEGTAAFALKMVHQGTKHRIFTSTARAMVDLLSMHGAAEMLVQRGQIAEAVLTKVAAEP